MKKSKSLLLLMFASLSGFCQTDGLVKIEVSVSGGLSLPMGNYKQVTLLPEEGGSATSGRYYKLGGTYWLGSNRHFGLSLSGGLYEHPFSDDKATLRVSVNRDPTVLEVDPWQVWSIVPNISARANWKIVNFKCHAGAGLAMIDGWDAYVEWYRVMFPANTSWQFPKEHQLCIDGGASIEFALSKRFALGLEAAILKTWFKEQGYKETITYDLFTPEMVVGISREMPKSNLNVLMANLGLVLSVRL
jgi:hypothetical protein